MSTHSKPTKSNGASTKKRIKKSPIPAPVVEALVTESGIIAQASAPPTAAIEQAARLLLQLPATLHLRPSVAIATRRWLQGEGLAPARLVDLCLETAAKHPEIVGPHFNAKAVEQSRAYIRALLPLVMALDTLARQLGDEMDRHKAIVGREARDLYRYLTAIVGTTRGVPIREPFERMVAAVKPKRASKPKSDAGAKAPVDGKTVTTVAVPPGPATTPAAPVPS